ncbi:MAG: O-antigen ligase family protein, partial [Pyrinomonadaceae bacterium]|nr:O-antigen ligase family protein [Pyrinomonadaceae bacterium]
MRSIAAKNQNATSLPASGALIKKENWLLKRGHVFSYAGLFLFTAVLYFRPYEIFPSLAGLSSMAFWIAIATVSIFIPTQFALEGTLTARPREVNFILLLTVAALVSIVFAISPVDAWNTFNELYMKVVLMFIITVNVVRTPRRLKGLMLLALSASVVVSISAINDYRLGNFTVEGYRVTGSIQKGSGMFGDPNDMALTLVMMIPITIALFFTSRNVIKKILYIVCVLLMILGITFTFSRGGFLGLVGMGIALAWKLGRRNRFLMSVAIVVALAGFLVLAPGNYRSRMATITSHGGEASAMSRQELLKRSIIIALKNPLTGVGMGNFGIVSIRN